MNSNLFTLTPVSTPPEKDDVYWILRPFDKGVGHYQKGKWSQGGLGAVTNYLRPISEEKFREVIKGVVNMARETEYVPAAENEVQERYGVQEIITNAIKALQNGK